MTRGEGGEGREGREGRRSKGGVGWVGGKREREWVKFFSHTE